MAIPETSWDETLPGPQNPFMRGDDRIREVKKQFREIFEVDHKMLSNGNGDEWGYHEQVTLIEQSEYPAKVSNSGIFFSHEANAVAELHYMDNNSTLQQLTSASNFVGGMNDEIRMWSGTLTELSAIPGWVLCDGYGGRIDLINKFIKNDKDNIATTGGDNNRTLTEAQMPEHQHSYGETGSAHVHSLSVVSPIGTVSDAFLEVAAQYRITSDRVNTAGSSHIHTAGSAGSGTSFDNRPAYYELAFIMRG